MEVNQDNFARADAAVATNNVAEFLAAMQAISEELGADLDEDLDAIEELETHKEAMHTYAEELEAWTATMSTRFRSGESTNPLTVRWPGLK